MKQDIDEYERKRIYYSEEFKRGCYNELKSKIIPLIESGVPILEIKKQFKINVKNILFLIAKKDYPKIEFKIFGNKNESYYSNEDEMIKAISYDYDSLSDEEKLIYNEL